MKVIFYYSLSLTTSVSGLGFPQFLNQAYVEDQNKNNLIGSVESKIEIYFRQEAKCGFFSESVFRFSNLQSKLLQITILSLKFE